MIYTDAETVFTDVLPIIYIYPSARKLLTDHFIDGVWTEGLISEATCASFGQTNTGCSAVFPNS